MRWIAATLLLAGCDSLVADKSHMCPGMGSGAFPDGWLCPSSLACAPAPDYCGPPDPNVLQCKMPMHDQEYDPCMTVTKDPGVCLTTNNQLVCTPCTPDILWCDYNYSGWYALTPATVPLHSVWSVDYADVYVAGESATLLHYDGLHWDPISLDMIPTGATLSSIFGVGSTDLFVVGANLAAHRSNGTWAVATAGPAGKVLHSVWAATPTDVFAVGDQSLITHFDGSAWTPMMTGPGPNLEAVAGTSGSDVYAVGVGGIVLHYDGVSWSTVVPFSASGIQLSAAWATAAGDVVVAGGTGTAQITRYHGGVAQPATVPIGVEGISSVWGGNGALFAAGSLEALVTSTDGLTWTAEPTKPSGSSIIYGLGGTTTGPTSVFAVGVVGASGLIWHYAGN